MKLGRDYIISINDVDQKVIFWKNIFGRILKKIKIKRNYEKIKIDKRSKIERNQKGKEWKE